jgi:hypothetical protein
MIELSNNEKEILIECLQYRLETDKTLENSILREDLEELLFKIEEDEYV